MYVITVHNVTDGKIDSQKDRYSQAMTMAMTTGMCFAG